MALNEQRRHGRQIPEWMVLSVVFSLSVILGSPLLARLRISYPEANKALLGVLGLVFGFVLLLGIWTAFGLLFVLLARVRKLIKR